MTHLVRVGASRRERSLRSRSLREHGRGARPTGGHRTGASLVRAVQRAIRQAGLVK